MSKKLLPWKRQQGILITMLNTVSIATSKKWFCHRMHRMHAVFEQNFIVFCHRISIILRMFEMLHQNVHISLQKITEHEDSVNSIHSVNKMTHSVKKHFSLFFSLSQNFMMLQNEQILLFSTIKHFPFCQRISWF